MNEPSRLQLLYNTQRYAWRASLFIVALHFITRIFCAYQYFKGDVAFEEWLRFFWVGLKFDLRIATIAMTVPLLLSFFLSSFKADFKIVKKMINGFGYLVVGLSVYLCIGLFYYYQTYQTNYDIFVFNALNGYGLQLLKAFWSDYPAVKIIASFIVLTIVSVAAFKQFMKRFEFKFSYPLHAFFVLLFLFLAFATANRGSLGTFPLRRENSQVSQNIVLNHLTPNGPMALSWAYKDKKKDTVFKAVNKSSYVAQLEKLFGVKDVYINGIGSALPPVFTPEEINAQQIKAKKEKRKKYLDRIKNNLKPEVKKETVPALPTVVFTLLEGFGSNILESDDAKTNDLLGALRPHFESDFLFKRFLSATNDTAATLYSILFQCANKNLSNSSVAKKQLSYSVFEEYKKAGYEVVFIKPGNMMWQNMLNYFPVQGIDTIYDENTLMAEYPESKKSKSAWGVADEYAYKYAKKVLQSNDKPKFIVILSVSNHPPYKHPKHYKPSVVHATEDYLGRSAGRKQNAEDLLKAYQYAANAYGEFVAWVKSSPGSENTIMAASGDHQMRRYKAKYPEELALNHMVPFYLYVPKPLLAKAPYLYDASAVGSHKDIIPTLLQFSLPEAKYINNGGMSLMKEPWAKRFAYNTSLYMDAENAVAFAAKDRVYAIDSSNQLKLDSKAVENKAFTERALLYRKFLKTVTNYQTMGFKE